MVTKLRTMAFATSFVLWSHGVLGYEIFRATKVNNHLPHELPHVVSLHQFSVVHEEGNRRPLEDTLVLETAILSEQDIGNVFTVTGESDPDFGRLAATLTNGIDDAINENIKFSHNATFRPSFFDHEHRDIPESTYFQTNGTAHPLFVGPDLTGFSIDSIQLVLTSFTGGPGRFDIDEAEIVLTYHGKFRADFDASESLDIGDIELLSAALRIGSNDLAFDLNADGIVDVLDRNAWVHDMKQTYFGDADLNRVFDSSDLVQVLSFGEYRDSLPLNSTWQTGDWDGDGDFTSSDLVVALADGGYNQGSRVAAVAVPDLSGLANLLIGLFAVATVPRTRRQRHGLTTIVENLS